MKKIKSIISTLLVFTMIFSIAAAIGSVSVKADSASFQIDPAGTLTSYSGIETKVVVPSTVKTIGEKAFASNKNIVSVELPSSVKVIKKSAFESCASLEKVVMSKKLTTIEDNAFYGCVSLKKISLPSTLKTVGYAAFCNCTSLNGINIPKSVEEINSYAFGFNMIGGYTSTPDFMIMGEGVAKIYADKYGFPYSTLKDLAMKPTSLKKASKSQALLKWKKNAKIDKCQIQIADNKKFKSSKDYDVNNNAVSELVFSKLKKNTTYYVRMRGVKELAGSNYSSKWSKIMKVTIK